MSEEKKTVELKEEELKKVGGGYSSEDGVETYEVDDCFKSGLMIYAITQACDSNSNWVYYDRYNEHGFLTFDYVNSDYRDPYQFNQIKGEYIGKKSTCGYTFTGK